MSPVYLIIHRDQPLSIRGINSGAEMATRMLARYLVRAGKRVVLAGQLTDGEQICDGVECWDLGPAFDTARALSRIRKYGSYHLISAGRALPILESRNDEACLSRTLITHDRSGNDTGIDPKVLCQIVDNILCVSHAQRDAFIEAGGDPAKLTVIHNGVDLDLFTPGAVEKRNFRKLIFVGALVIDKGLHVLLHAYSVLKGRYKDLTLDVYGSSKLWGREKILDEAQVERDFPGVKFHGGVTQEKIVPALQGAGVCVIPSIWFDPFPLVSLEAQATGCPVVAFDVGGLKEGIVDGETGLVVKDVTPEALVRALDTLLGVPETIKRMSLNASSEVRKRFTWERVVRDVVAHCEKNVSSTADNSHGLVAKRIGIVTTWNQECGIAKNAKYFVSEFEKDTYVIFGENVGTARTEPDEGFVLRCWDRKNNDLSLLESEVYRSDIGVLHLNFHTYHFISVDALLPVLARMRARGIKVLLHLHTTFTLDPLFVAMTKSVDGIVTHTIENRLQAIANGADPKSTWVIPLGVKRMKRLSSAEREDMRRVLGVLPGEKLLLSFGFIQPYKGIEALLEAVLHLKSRGIPARGVIAGKPQDDFAPSVDYFHALKDLAVRAGISDRVTFTNMFASDDDMHKYFGASDVVFMNYQSQYYESSAACNAAVGSGALVIASLSPNCAPFGDAVWHLTSGFTPGLSAEILLTNEEVQNTVRESAERYSDKFSWREIYTKFIEVYRMLGVEPTAHAFPVLGDIRDLLSDSTSGSETRAQQQAKYDLEIAKLEEEKRRKNFQLLITQAPEMLKGADLNARQRETLSTLLAEVKALTGDLAGAGALLDEVIKINPASARALCGKGALEADRGDWSKARTYFAQARSIDSGNDIAIAGLAMCQSAVGSLDEAWKLYGEAARKNPENMRALVGLIEIGYGRKEYRAIQEALEAYLDLHPLDLNLLYSLAGCYYAQSKMDEADEVLTKIIEFEPNHKNARELREIIQQSVPTVR